MNGFVQVLVSLELVEAWDAEIAEAVRESASEGATRMGGRLIAGDPEFIFSPKDEPGFVRVQYRMVK